MQDFVEAHKAQLDLLNIPEPLFEGLHQQLEATFVQNEGNGELDITCMARSHLETLSNSEFGAMVVIPHICSWDILGSPSRGMWEALEKVPVAVLNIVYNGLRRLWGETQLQQVDPDKEALLNGICDPRTWSRVILYRHGTSVRAALPAPPYFPQEALQSSSDTTEADLTGPFPFEYHLPSHGTIELSLAYLSPGVALENGRLPTLDLVPPYSCPDPLTRAVRYVALLGTDAPAACLATVKDAHATFVHKMHLIRQQKLQRGEEHTGTHETEELTVSPSRDKVWRVYTDTDDPMELAHPQAGLTPSKFVITQSLEDADIIYSYKSLFAPGEMLELIGHRSVGPNPVLINQFPYEGALVQKDHLGREILRQHGLSLPKWALETYDLDEQLTEFVGAAVLAAERGEEPLWIVKPARGTQSKGHVVTFSTAQVLRLVDAGGESRVVQRYIRNPICVDGRKVDCRCIVIMTCATPGRPTLFMHNRVFFRIANKVHSIATPGNIMDAESVLTATHLIDEKNRTSSTQPRTLAVDHTTIAKLEENYSAIGFDWNGNVLPQIQSMIRELFNGMTNAFPTMSQSRQSRALYGVDVMFDVESDCVQVKLTEVTFCPANNAICDAYEKDDKLFRSYNSDVFSCMFLGQVPDSITQLQ